MDHPYRAPRHLGSRFVLEHKQRELFAARCIVDCMPAGEKIISKPRFLRAVLLQRDLIPADSFLHSMPALRNMRRLALEGSVVFFVGENASGKSTLLEAIAVAVRLNPEGGSTDFRFSMRPSESELHEALTLERSPKRPKTAFFLRAESFFNLATEVERLGVQGAYGDRSLHEQSHGESFLSVAMNRFGPDGLYLLDEPEAALSIRGQLALLRRMYDLVQAGSQFLVATHSPLLLAYPRAAIYELSAEGIRRVRYEETDNFTLTKSFLEQPERFFRHLLSDD